MSSKNEYQKIGEIYIPKNTKFLDITDPCYSEDVFCRLRAPIQKTGQYNCFVYIKNNRIFSTAIIFKEYFPLSAFNLKQEFIGTIGVDSGTAGYFVSKIDYSDEQWKEVCDFIQQSSNHNYFFGKKNNAMKSTGFFSYSGYGDGEYPVFAITISNLIVGYKIEF